MGEIEYVKVEVGQVWADMEPLFAGRIIKVVKVDLPNVHVRTIRGSGGAPVQDAPVRRLSLNSFTPGSKFRLVTNADGSPA